jgi:hypothetical protein
MIQSPTCSADKIFFALFTSPLLTAIPLPHRLILLDLTVDDLKEHTRPFGRNSSVEARNLLSPIVD